MKLRINLILAISFLGLVHAFAPRASAQQADAGMTNIREVNSLGTSVCEETEINPQVREALRLICIRTGADEKRPATSGLIVVGFLGGFAKSGDSNHPEVWFGAYLRQRYPSATEVSVLSNHQGRRAIRDILRLLDKDHDGALTAAEKSRAQIILYGHSWGASETAALSRELGRLGIPVLLTVQIDIVRKPGEQPVRIPRNVEAAVNFYQTDGFLRGRPEIVAEDPERTEIIGNYHMTYEAQRIDCRNYSWFARTFNKPHHKIENDARVWNQIGAIIDSRLSSASTPAVEAATR